MNIIVFLLARPRLNVIFYLSVASLKKCGVTHAITHIPYIIFCLFCLFFHCQLEKELKHLYKQRSLTDLDLRMRFLMCILVEDVLRALAPDIHIVPFGSCLNGFGWWKSDLDMMVCFHDDPFKTVCVQL